MSKQRQAEIVELLEEKLDPTLTTRGVAKVIDEAYILIPRSELPSVRTHETDPGIVEPGQVRIGDRTIPFNGYDLEGVRFRVRQWAHIEEYLITEDEREAERLRKRRDEIGREFHPQVPRYEDQTPTVRKAVDRIIELEEALKEAQK